jgi:malonyl CoA-acyl carrier protein transacylase
MDPREAAIRAASTAALAKVIKRMRYDERQIIQVLRCNSEKAQWILTGQLDAFSTAEIKKFVDVLG